MKRMLSVFGALLAACLCFAFPVIASDADLMVKPAPLVIEHGVGTPDTAAPMPVAMCSLAVPLIAPKRHLVASGYGDAAIGAVFVFAGSSRMPGLHRPHEDPGRMRA